MMYAYAFKRRTALSIVMFAALAGAVAGCGGTPSDTPVGKGNKSDVVPSTPNVTIKIGPAAVPRDETPPTPRLIVRDKRDWTLPETAARSLGRIGEAAVPDLTKQLTDDDPLIRKRAADVLARIGPEAERAVPDLVAALEDDDEAVRKSAALALGQIGPAAADAVPALVRVMNEPGFKAPAEEP